MHIEEWSGRRVAAVLASLVDAGIPQSRLARMAGVNRSQVNRWSRGENRPGHDAVRRLAAAVYRQHPREARELIEASGYPWAEPGVIPEPTVSPSLLASIRKEFPDDPAAQQRVIDAVERTMRGDPPPSAQAEAGGSRGERSA